MPPNHALSSFLLRPPFTLPEELEFNIKVLLNYKTAWCTQLKFKKKQNKNRRQLDQNEDSLLGDRQLLKRNHLQSYN